MNIINESKLLDFIAKINKHAWIGLTPPFNMDIVDMDKCTNFRVSPNLHQQYEAVWLYENRIDRYHILSWKLIIDEALRMLDESGFLVLRISENRDITVPMLKCFLGRNINIEIDIHFEYRNENNEYIIALRVKRLNISKYRDNLWTFAILTNGTKDENVIKFLDSIRHNDIEYRHEIIISGPQKKDIFNNYNVKYIDISQFRDDQYAEISKKKNLIAKIASNPNLLISHDRYYLSNSFFSDFEKYGYDFDFLTIRQFFENGREYPSYCFLYEPTLTWTHPVTCRNYQYLFNTQYVNGGLMIFKTHNLKILPFNELLLWGQQEDVEITQVFMNNSLVPRVNFINNVYAIDDKTQRMNSALLFDTFNGKEIIYGVPKAARSKIYGLNDSHDISDVSIHPGEFEKNISLRTKLKSKFKTKFPFIAKILKKIIIIIRGKKINKSSKLKVLYDITVLGVGFENEEHRTGVYRVAQEALKALMTVDIDLYLCAASGNEEACEKYIAIFNPDLLHKFKQLNEKTRLRRLVDNITYEYDYYVSPYFSVHNNYRKNVYIKKIIIVHDLIQVKFKDWVKNEDYKNYSQFLSKFDKNTIALCNSECTRKDFLKWKSKFKPSNTRVIPLGADKKFKRYTDNTQLNKIRTKYKIPLGDYFFSISSMNPRKNFKHTVECFLNFLKENEASELILVLSGPQGWGDFWDGMNFKEYENKIIFTGFVEEEDLPYLYSGAIASVYVSLYEGFGLPPLESLYCGTPVIASNTSSIPEVVGGGAILVDPQNNEQLIEAYKKCMDEKFRNTLIENAKPSIEKYTWENFAAYLIQEIK